LELPENIETKIVHADIGPVSDSDVILADAS
jgi:translation initiation factor IF-2